MDTVGIIGCGAAGLCAARQVLATGKYKPQVWELSEGLGGTWRYNPDTGRDKYGIPIHSSMYQNLKTNLPKEVMSFPEFPFPTGGDSFLHHTKIVQYLKDYAEHFNLFQYIQFEHYVENVEPIPQEEGFPHWAVTVKDLKEGTTIITVCQAVIVCNGHYSVPRIPKLPFIEDFQGRQMHSHDYRDSSPFKGANVLVLGSGASGLDISLEISTVANKVMLSHNLPSPNQSKLPPNVTQVKGADSAYPKGFHLVDGTSVEADFILYCTGYEYSFPFLSEKCGIEVTKNQVSPLYKHLINAAMPSMGFLGIPFQICPFPFFDFQSRFFMKVMTGELDLPSLPEMLEEIEKDHQESLKKGVPEKHFHNMSIRQWQYTRDMAEMAGLETTMPVIEKLFTAVREIRNKTLMTYKSTTYIITGPETFECVH
ncbi:hypothetical protein SK128_028187 [Halocaridina rubra]|uniref:Flavin-containing monooxygenase n=1 Tax=Halocaridina rubra TaxID=373956 RepID=A0AAN8ZT59_HALRR